MIIWQQFLDSLQGDIGRQTVDRWLRPLTVLKYDAGNIYLQADDSFAAEWFEEHIRPLSGKRLKSNSGRPIKVHLSVKNQVLPKAKSDQSPQTSTDKIEFVSQKLDPGHTFEQFIAGNENIVPLKVLCGLAGYDLDTHKFVEPTTDPTTYNPVFIYGGSGVGKTHLLMAAASIYQLKGKRVFYTTASSFTNHVVLAIRRSMMREFRAAYRHVDILIIDDVQDLVRKNATQEELFHTFNALHTQGKQIILSANTSPQMLEGIEERLISRFEWGITLPITAITQMSELQELLSRRSSLFKFPIERDLSDFIAQKFPTAKSLNHALESLILGTHLDKVDTSHPLPLNTVKDQLTRLYEEENKAKLTPDRILQMISDIFGLKIEDITGKSQSRECVLPRQIAMYILRNELKLPYMKIGRVFSRDHSTVMSSIKLIKKGLEAKDQEIAFYLSETHRKLLATT